MSDKPPPQEEGARLLPLIREATRPIYDLIVAEAAAFREKGYDEEDQANHAFSSLCVAVSILTRGIAHEHPLLQDENADNSWLYLAVERGFAQARKGIPLDDGSPM